MASCYGKRRNLINLDLQFTSVPGEETGGGGGGGEEEEKE